MQIILLSGGSGKRFWPLSNDVRSKQFLKLLPTSSGEKESMLQRVVRQIKQSEIDCSITVATGSSQKDLIQNQLDKNVNVVEEPLRRGTFPAIALSLAYLSCEKQCSDDEVVVVLPCDTYTVSRYYDVISEIGEAAKHNDYDLILMGVTPNCFSAKFGYIIPENQNISSGAIKVKSFIEKPDIEKARELVENGAYWNGGVFAFKLGYIREIVKKYFDYNSYRDLLANYDKLPKISFDYEVVEKTENLAVVPFSGLWKDLGSWQSMTDELSKEPIGKVYEGDNVNNTHVINELNIPVFCAGINNLIVAASPDGILVADKNSSEQVKNYVKNMPARPMYEERRWGIYKVIDYIKFSNGYQALTKQICIKAGRYISYQIHHHRDEVWTIVDGTGLLVVDGNVTEVKCGDVIHIKREHLHAIKAISDLYFIEVQSGEKLVEEDIERFDWDWNNK